MKKKVILFCLICFFTCATHAQVTIGSGIEPQKGALLDLKEKTPVDPAVDNRTATKGMMLPRVNLTDWRSLFPMFSADPDYMNNTGNRKDNQDKAHTGLTVYNLNHCFNAVTADGTGVYTWNGQRWVTWSDNTLSLTSGVQQHTDQDGNTFLSGDFDGAGRWMLYNLRAKKYADGTSLPASPSLDLSDSEAKWMYPMPDGGDGMSDKWVNDFEPLGLMYNGYAALGGHKVSSMDQGQIAGATPGPQEVESIGKIQGICPDGWHIPSDREWNELEKEIYNNREKYSSYTSADVAFSPATWNPAWETQSPYPPTWDRGSDSSTGHNPAMIAPCQASVFGNTFKSKPTTKGGFYVILAGRITSGPIRTTNFGAEGNMASSSLQNSGDPYSQSMYMRSFYANSRKVQRNRLEYYMYVSVRCKKDVP